MLRTVARLLLGYRQLYDVIPWAQNCITPFQRYCDNNITYPLPQAVTREPLNS